MLIVPVDLFSIFLQYSLYLSWLDIIDIIIYSFPFGSNQHYWYASELMDIFIMDSEWRSEMWLVIRLYFCEIFLRWKCYHRQSRFDVYQKLLPKGKVIQCDHARYIEFSSNASIEHVMFSSVIGKEYLSISSLKRSMHGRVCSWKAWPQF